jgi:hypothetical protein
MSIFERLLFPTRDTTPNYDSESRVHDEELQARREIIRESESRYVDAAADRILPGLSEAHRAMAKARQWYYKHHGLDQCGQVITRDIWKDPDLTPEMPEGLSWDDIKAPPPRRW